MVKKILLVVGVVGILASGCDYVYAGEESYIHCGFSGMRIIDKDYNGIYKFLQVNGSLYPHQECENVPFTDWRKRLYFYLGLNNKRDHTIGVGYYGLTGKFGIQAGNYYNRLKSEDNFCYGLYIDASVLRKLWEVTKPVIDTYSEITK